MKVWNAILVFLTAAILSSCAQLPTPAEMQAATANYKLPKEVSKDKAMVYVVRPSGLGGLIRFNVFLDDQADISEMGYTRGNQYIYFSMNPGTHKIYSLAENWAEVEVSAKAGEVLYLKQTAQMGILFARNDMQKVEELEGKYHLTTLAPGTIIKEEKDSNKLAEK